MITTTTSDEQAGLLRVLRLAGCGPGCHMTRDYQVERLQARVSHSTWRMAAAVDFDHRVYRTFQDSPAEARLIAWVRALHAAEDAYYARPQVEDKS